MDDWLTSGEFGEVKVCIVVLAHKYGGKFIDPKMLFVRLAFVLAFLLAALIFCLKSLCGRCLRKTKA